MVPRSQSFLDELFRTTPFGRVILVTHGGTMKSLQLVIEGEGAKTEHHLAERHLTNCSVLRVSAERCNSAREACHHGQVRFASPALPDCPVSDWEPVAGC